MTETHDLHRITDAAGRVRGAAAVELQPEHRTWDRLAGRVALVTGAARGQGAAAARLFAAEGAAVLATDILEEVEGVAAELGGAVRAARLDVTSEDDWARAVEEAEAAFGPVDILVNNAGRSEIGLIESLPLDTYLEIVHINQVGTLLGMRAVIPSMIAAGGGAIVNVSSVDGLAAHPAIASYVSSKFAIRGLTKVAALELGARGIRVNCIHPGAVDTPMLRPPDIEADEIFEGLKPQIPLGFVATPDDIARVVLFLVSHEARYITGTEIVADGGVMAKVPLGPS
jgi:3alpha(or 20beta)-hydroxysteroid dehydrogenase